MAGDEGRDLLAKTRPGSIGVARCGDGMVGIVVNGASPVFVRLEPDAARKFARDLVDAAKTPKKAPRKSAGIAGSEKIK